MGRKHPLIVGALCTVSHIIRAVSTNIVQTLYQSAKQAELQQCPYNTLNGSHSSCADTCSLWGDKKAQWSKSSFNTSRPYCGMLAQQKPGLYPKSPAISSFAIPYISPLIQFTWRSECKRVSEFGHRKDRHFYIVCLLFNNHLKLAASVVRLKDLSLTLSRKLCITPNSQFTIILYLCITLYYAVDEHL